MSESEDQDRWAAGDRTRSERRRRVGADEGDVRQLLDEVADRLNETVDELRNNDRP